MPARPQPLPPELGSGPFAVSRNGAGGVSRGRLRASDIARPHRGVAVAHDVFETLDDRAAAAVRFAGPAAWLSHSTAMLLAGLPLPRRLEVGPIHVAVATPRVAPRARGITGHRLDLRDHERDVLHVTRVDRGRTVLPAVAAPRALLTVASELRLPDLVAVVDALRFRTTEAHRARADSTQREWRDSQRWDDDRLAHEMGRLIAEHTGARGLVALKAAWNASRLGVRSRPESLLRIALCAARLPEPVVGHTIYGTGWTATPDLAWPQWKVLVEYEGEHHRTNRRQFEHDLKRFERFIDEGWRPIRVVRPDLFHNPVPMLYRVADRLRAAGWRPQRHWTLRPVPAFLP